VIPSLKNLVESVVLSLVDDTSQVKILTSVREGQAILTVLVAADDVGRVVGKEGRIVNALRTVVKAGAAKANQRVSVEVLSISEYVGE
jgi:hypothetical protein